MSERFDYVQALYGIGTCQGCKRVYTLTKAGNVRAHNHGIIGAGNPHPKRCSGSGKEPMQRPLGDRTHDEIAAEKLADDR